jgi:hypothetical protein
LIQTVAAADPFVGQSQTPSAPGNVFLTSQLASQPLNAAKRTSMIATESISFAFVMRFDLDRHICSVHEAQADPS